MIIDVYFDLKNICLNLKSNFCLLLARAPYDGDWGMHRGGGGGHKHFHVKGIHVKQHIDMLLNKTKQLSCNLLCLA